ncbi:MAG: hypothetical protein HRF45_07665 [Fimbriimonadia bacterium]|jgi:hypothetical protein
MNCVQARDRFSEYREGNLSEGLAGHLRRHMETCAECRAAFAEFERVWQMLGEIEEAPIPDNLDYYIRARISNDALQAREAARGSWLRWVRNVTAVGAVAAVLVIAYMNVVPEGLQISGLFGRTEEPTPLDVTVQSLSWNERAPALEITANTATDVRLQQLSGYGDASEVDSFRVGKDKTVRVALKSLADASRPTVLWVTTTTDGRDQMEFYVLPFGPAVKAEVVTGEALSVLLTAASHYDVPIVVRWTVPSGQLLVDCRSGSIQEALRQAKGLEDWVAERMGDFVELRPNR